MSKRAIIIVLDSAGVGELPDAAKFGDVGSNTIGHIIEKRGLDVPNMEKLGLFSIPNTGFERKSKDAIVGNYGKCNELTMGKDTTSGHWEMAGYIRPLPFRTYPNGFPDELIKEYEAKIGRKILGNCVASGTEIINRLGDEHVKTGFPIVYTSADSVFQVAAHEDVISVKQLYEFCQMARDMLTGENAVGRVIARPFIGTSGAYTRTANRHDYAVEPEEDTMLDEISKAGQMVLGIGKISDIFCQRGITDKELTKNNEQGINATIEAIKRDSNGLIFTNLVDFDMQYGHRNDIEGYGKALEYFDSRLPEILSALKDEDMLIITADHGCDPSTPSTDHSREYIPILISGPLLKQCVDVGIRDTFADIAASVVEYLGLPAWHRGKSFIAQIQ